jgi:hypothetical protein
MEPYLMVIVGDSHQRESIKMKVIVIGRNAWGKGDTVSEAFQSALKNAPYNMRDSRTKKNYRNEKCFAVWVAADDAYVNGMGGINYRTDSGFEPQRLGYLDIDQKLIVDWDDYPAQMKLPVEAKQEVDA